jgi:Tol biopolymer transport system component
MFRIVAIAVLAAALTQQPAKPPAPPPATDIHELVFDGTLAGLKSAKPRGVATERGYENQPSFTPDGNTILFTANRDGKQTDIFEFDRASRKSRQLVATPEAEYSPTVTPDGTGFSVIRVESDGTQRLWRFDRRGENPRIVLNDIKPVGYHTWVDADTLVLFVLGPPATLHLARVPTGKSEVLARDIGRSLQRIPGGSSVSFVQRDAEGEFSINALDPAKSSITRLVRALPGSTDRDCAWLADGTLLMSAGTRIFAHRPTMPPSGPESWTEAFDTAAHKLGPVTRMAVAPDGKALAFVVGEAPRP